MLAQHPLDHRKHYYIDYGKPYSEKVDDRHPSYLGSTLLQKKEQNKKNFKNQNIFPENIQEENNI